ncbi:hypothetical protein PAXINDRAFT_101973 [Paxillus involutus ATCC 200175]|uniref:Protein kinase domain-containing protein n=1 Tax=Paxillus involutus ATCC 200175 TaxID=664439 RepID=A0A0C9TIH1_PAXIN|nr:hypothetical protein PAXINDRAFT_101973 [Paxillus involutus ATCC 200175]
MQCANIAANHVLNFIVIGDEIWIWNYDHQGLIGVGGFNFVQDLPRFLVLLYALQRFNLEDWGRNPAFKPQPNGDDVTVKVDDTELTLKESVIDTRLVLKGRGTGVVDVTCENLELEKPPEEAEGGMVAKIYWAEEARTSEETILDKVKEVAGNDEAVRGHVPILLLAKKFPVSTSTIRKALGLDDPDKGSRTLFLLVFKKLSPIEELQGDELFDAWRQCVLCHYILWKAGIYHRDVSCENLMYYRVDSNVVGVLNDYDLASLAREDNPLGNERNGTTPYMAIDLLRADGQAGNVKHIYRHDMESFIWVFIWISIQYKDGKLRDRGPLDAFAKVDARGCVKEKRNFLADPQAYCDIPGRVYGLVIFLGRQQHPREDTRSELQAAKTALRESLADLAPDVSRIAELEQEIAKHELDLEEKSDDAVFTEFAKQIRVETASVDTIISRSSKLEPEDK